MKHLSFKSSEKIKWWMVYPVNKKDFNSATNLLDVGDSSNNLIINGGHKEACSLNSPTVPIGKFLVSHVRIEVFPVISKL